MMPSSHDSKHERDIVHDRLTKGLFHYFSMGAIHVWEKLKKWEGQKVIHVW